MIAPWKTFLTVFAAASLFACTQQSDETITAPAHLTHATTGSIVVSSVTVTTTTCHRWQRCSTTRLVALAHQQVGFKQGDLHLAEAGPALKRSVQSSPEHNLPRSDKDAEDAAHRVKIKKVEDDGATLALEHESAGSTWRYAATRAHPGDNRHFVDAKIYQNGKLLISTEATWDTVAGVEFARHHKISFYTSSGQLAIQRETSVDPISVSSATISSSVSLEPVVTDGPSNVYAPDECPILIPCQWWDNWYDPQPALQSFIDGLGSALSALGGAIDQFWQNSEVGAIEGAAETLMTLHEAFQAPSISNFFSLIVTMLSQPSFYLWMEELVLWFLSVFGEYLPYFFA